MWNNNRVEFIKLKIVYADLHNFLHLPKIKGLSNQTKKIISEFSIPDDLTRPLRYSKNVLKTCELNRDATNDSR